jgi:hypothetical protein
LQSANAALYTVKKYRAQNKERNMQGVVDADTHIAEPEAMWK